MPKYHLKVHCGATSAVSSFDQMKLFEVNVVVSNMQCQLSLVSVTV